MIGDSKLPAIINPTAEYLKDPGKPFSLSGLLGINEDYSWFGPVSFLLLIPAFIVGIAPQLGVSNFTPGLRFDPEFPDPQKVTTF
ncbi:MAG: hypothetical protein NTZ74_11325 [Chloroflexi bacterium]|nr:hypothetical protein [Chloroflexota bacterium]